MFRKTAVHKKAARILIAVWCLLCMTGLLAPVHAVAETGPESVRIGYYENEVFQEGAVELQPFPMDLTCTRYLTT